jgi:hypothetical protein
MAFLCGIASVISFVILHISVSTINERDQRSVPKQE